MEIPKETVQNLLSPVLSKMGLGSLAHLEAHHIKARLWLSIAIKVEIITEDGKKVNLFIKCLPRDILRREIFGAPAFFRNEVAFYKMVMPTFLEFQKDIIGMKNAFTAVPKCYYAHSDGENDVLVLQDMEAKGYFMPKNSKMMSVEQLHLLMKELGRFHAVSLTMKLQDPEKFKNVKNALEETVWNERFLGRIGKRLFTETCADAIRLLKEIYSEENMYVTTVQRFLDNIVPVMTQQVTPEEPLSVVTHGDFWINNFMFRFSEANNLEHSCFLDFQQSRYASPALDLGSALFMCMDKATRDEHRGALLRSYHDSLGELMRSLGSDPDEIFPYEKLEEQLSKYSLYGLANAFVNLPNALDEYEGGVEEMALLEKLGQAPASSVVGTVDIIFKEIEKPHYRKTDQCKQRLLDVIKEAVDRCYMDSITR